jgi:hypothetical protein
MNWSTCNYIGLFSNNYLTDYMDYVGTVIASNYCTTWTVFIMQLSGHRICDTRLHVSHILTSTIYVNFPILIFTDHCPFLGAFTTLRKAAINITTSFCQSVLPHGTTRLLIEGISLHFTFRFFPKPVEKSRVLLISD